MVMDVVYLAALTALWLAGIGLARGCARLEHTKPRV